MDELRFDRFTRMLGRGASRSSTLKALLGVGGVAAFKEVAFQDTVAARRG